MKFIVGTLSIQKITDFNSINQFSISRNNVLKTLKTTLFQKKKLLLLLFVYWLTFHFVLNFNELMIINKLTTKKCLEYTLDKDLNLTYSGGLTLRILH